MVLQIQLMSDTNFKHLFSNWIYKVELDSSEEQEIRNLYTNDILKECKSMKLPEGWHCRVYTSFGKDYISKIDYYEFKRILTPYIQKFLDSVYEVNVTLDLTKHTKCNPWYNVYAKGSWQERHNHSPGGFSIIYYLKFNENEHSPTCFHNPSPLVPFMNFGYPLKKDTPIHQSSVPYWIPKVKQGDLIIFPAALDHNVPVCHSDEERIAIAFNI